MKKRRSQSAHEVGLYSSAHDETSRQLNDETSKQLNNETSSKQFYNETTRHLNDGTSRQFNNEALQHFNDETMDPLVPPSNGLRKLSPDIIVTRSVRKGSKEIVISTFL
jgi:hypothetical protein